MTDRNYMVWVKKNAEGRMRWKFYGTTKTLRLAREVKKDVEKAGWAKDVKITTFKKAMKLADKQKVMI